MARKSGEPLGSQPESIIAKVTPIDEWTCSKVFRSLDDERQGLRLGYALREQQPNLVHIFDFYSEGRNGVVRTQEALRPGWYVSGMVLYDLVLDKAARRHRLELPKLSLDAVTVREALLLVDEDVSLGDALVKLDTVTRITSELYRPSFEQNLDTARFPGHLIKDLMKDGRDIDAEFRLFVAGHDAEEKRNFYKNTNLAAKNGLSRDIQAFCTEEEPFINQFKIQYGEKTFNSDDGLSFMAGATDSKQLFIAQEQIEAGLPI